MVKLQNLISRKSVPPFQKQPFADVLQSRLGILKNYAIFTGKHQRWSLFFNKVPVL